MWLLHHFVNQSYSVSIPSSEGLIGTEKSALFQNWTSQKYFQIKIIPPTQFFFKNILPPPPPLPSSHAFFLFWKQNSYPHFYFLLHVSITCGLLNSKLNRQMHFSLTSIECSAASPSFRLLPSAVIKSNR